MRTEYVVGKTFPVLWDHTTPEHERTPKLIQWDALNEEWAQKNHGQSLTRLAERHGLSPCEALANIERRPYARIDFNYARQAIAAYEAAEGKTSSEGEKHA